MSRKRKPTKQSAGPASSGKHPREKNAPAGATMAMFVVDRKEGDVIVVVDGAGRAMDVPSARLRPQARAEGAVLRVPIDTNGTPQWESAVRDRAEERRRRAMMAARIKRLKRTDPGGDVKL
jgi:hypothetical protein